jgi:hypothetical protein
MPGPIESPCRQICRLGDDGRCDGCGRTLDEVARWSSLAPAERRVVMQRVKDWTPRPPDPAPPR